MKKEMSRVLVLCAHPDDEALGLGGTISLLTKKGHKVFVLFFCDGESARTTSIKIIKRREQHAKQACKILGITDLKFLRYKDEKLDTIPILNLVKDIEIAIEKWQPSMIFTHFEGDLNQDHRRVFEATMIATRPIPTSRINQLICYETPSSTEWGFQKFNPNLFVEINSVLKNKLKSFTEYKQEIMDKPHPRSKESLVNRSSYWGSIIGSEHAEAFYSIREIKKEF